MQIKNAIDITDKWIYKKKKGHVKDLQILKYKNHIYKVDKHNVTLDYSSLEFDIAKTLSIKYGKDVCMVPRVNNPENIQTPDYLIDGACFDLKTPRGTSKHSFYNMIKKKKKQSNNFIFNITYTSISKHEIIQQIEYIYKSKSTYFVNILVIMRKQTIIGVYKKKKR